MGVRAGLASRAVADRSGHGLRRHPGRGAVSSRPTAGRTGRSYPDSARIGPAAAGSLAPADCACTRSCSIRATPQRMFVAISAAGAFRTDDGGTTWQPINQRAEVRGHSEPDRRSRPLRAPHRPCTGRGPGCCSCRSTGTSCAATTRGDSWTRGQRQPADRFRFPDRRPRARARHDLRRADQERL